MSEACHDCGAAALASVAFRGRDDIKAIVCLACGVVQPVAVEQKSRDS